MRAGHGGRWLCPAFATPKFPALTAAAWSTRPNILSPAAEATIDAEADGAGAPTGRQLVVVTVPSLQGYEIEDYGYQLRRHWGVGRKEQDDGAILIVAPNERKVRIEVGYGLEPVLTDALSSVILQRKVLPRFRQRRLEQGVVDGAEAVIQQLALADDEAGAPKVAQAAADHGTPAAAAQVRRSSSWSFCRLLGDHAPLRAAADGGGRRYRRQRRRGLAALIVAA